MNKNRLVGIYILVFSILHIVYSLINHIEPSILVSLLGLTSYILQVKGNQIYKTLQLIWIVAQIPIITTSQNIGNTINEITILDLSQLFEFPITFGLQFSSTWYSIGVNLAAIIYLIVFKTLVRDEYLKQEVKIIIDNDKSDVYEHSPLNAEIIGYKKEWFTAKLINEIEINGSKLNLVRFKLKKGIFFQPKKEKQQCEIKLGSTIHGHEINELGFVE